MPREFTQHIGGVVEAIETVGPSAACVRLRPATSEEWLNREVLLAMTVDPEQFLDEMVLITLTITGRFFQTITQRIESATAAEESREMSADNWKQIISHAHRIRAGKK